jgi:hypothetical protein
LVSIWKAAAKVSWKDCPGRDSKPDLLNTRIDSWPRGQRASRDALNITLRATRTEGIKAHQDGRQTFPNNEETLIHSCECCALSGGDKFILKLDADKNIVLPAKRVRRQVTSPS